MNDDLSEYFSGKKLYGDGFSAAEISAWFEREREGYANLGARDRSNYSYSYHALNHHHGFRHIPRRFVHVLGIGSAWGEELRSLKADSVTILEPSDAFSASGISYVKPLPSGVMPFADETFDLVVCFGVLHHIPNVSFVVREMCRCMMPGAYALVREPIVSMGDWRKPRPGLTACERGIPRSILSSLFEEAGLRIVRRSQCVFPITRRLASVLSTSPFNSRLAVSLDSLMSALPWRYRYHSVKSWQKLQPSSEFFILQRRNADEPTDTGRH